jgi:uncharacterized integral membrane protein (TIGR00698 family)
MATATLPYDREPCMTTIQYAIQQPHPKRSPFAVVLATAPGLALVSSLAACGFALRYMPGLNLVSPMILSILLGIGVQNIVGTPAAAKPGVTFSMRRILRAAIILLGLQLSAQQIAEVGGRGVVIIATVLAATFVMTKLLGRLLGVERKLAELIAAGTAICGASAVIATNTVTDAPDEDVAYAVACVTVFGSMAMLGYPVLEHVLQLSPHAYGLWTGASIHEIAQVVAASFQDGKAAGEFGTIAKLTRVSMLAPVVMVLGLVASRRSPGQGARKSAPVPLFVLGFIALVILNSLFAIPAAPKGWILVATTFLLSMSLAAMGLETDIRRLAAKGLRPLALGALSWLFVASFSFVLIRAFG